MSVRRDGDRATARARRPLAARRRVGLPHRAAAAAASTTRGSRSSARPWPTPTWRRARCCGRRSVQAPRAPITDRAGAPVVADRPVVTVGLQPSRATDLAATVARVARADRCRGAGRCSSGRALPGRTTSWRSSCCAGRPTTPCASELRPVPGVVLREGTRQLAPTAAFARALLGSVGPATAEVVERSGGTRARRPVGRACPACSGRFDEQLGGDARARGGGRGRRRRGGPLAVLHAAGPRHAPAAHARPGRAARRGRGPRDRARGQGRRPGRGAAEHRRRARRRQRRAGRAGRRPRAHRPLPARLDVQDGVRAGPAAHRAAARRRRPVPRDGHASTARRSRTPRTRCSATSRSPPTSPTPATPRSSAAPERISSAQLEAAAVDLGLTAYDLGIDVFGAEVPVTDDPVEHAAQVIGQGRVLASPLAVAVGAATVEAGRLRLPRLLVAGAGDRARPGAGRGGRAAGADAVGRHRAAPAPPCATCRASRCAARRAPRSTAPTSRRARTRGSRGRRATSPSPSSSRTAGSAAQAAAPVAAELLRALR